MVLSGTCTTSQDKETSNERDTLSPSSSAMVQEPSVTADRVSTTSQNAEEYKTLSHNSKCLCLMQNTK